MEWTREQKLAALLLLPWTIRVERDPDEGYMVARVPEVPSAIATANDEAGLERELWESLQLSLEVALDHGDPISLPAQVPVLPWEAKRTGPRVRVLQADLRKGAIWDTVALPETAVAGGPPIGVANQL